MRLGDRLVDRGLAVLAVCLLGQLVAGQLQLLAMPGGVLPSEEAPVVAVSTGFDTFILGHLTKGDGVLLFAARPDDSAYHELSYALEPTSQVWYSTPLPAHAPPDWWISDDGSAVHLRELARRLGAQYVAFYNTPPPLGLVGNVQFVLRPGFSLLWLDSS